MNLTKLKIDPRSIGKKLLLTDVTPAYIYKDGVKTNDIEGYRYSIVLPDLGFEKLSVKILGDKCLDKPESYIEVAIDGLDMSLYYRNGTYDVSATATGIHAIKQSQ